MDYKITLSMFIKIKEVTQNQVKKKTKKYKKTVREI